MTAGAERRVDFASPPVTCAAKGGCSYLRALSTIEHLAGFETTAQGYAKAAARCREHGCWAASQEDVAPEPHVAGAAPIPLKVSAGTARSIRDSAATTGTGVIPFDRSPARDIMRDSDGNYVDRRSLKLESLADPSDSLGYLFQYWRNLRVATDCKFSNIDTVHLMRAQILGKLHVVNVASAEPENFRFELFGYAVPLSRYETLGAVPVAIYGQSTMHDYNVVRLAAAPRLHRVRSRIEGVNYHYTRLILPFLDADDLVDRLLVGIRQEPGDGVKVEPAS